MSNIPSVTEADIMTKVIAPDRPGISEDVARSFLKLRFDGETRKEIRRFLEKNNRGTITADERLTLEKYLRVGQFLDLLQAKARLSLQHAADER